MIYHNESSKSVFSGKDRTRRDMAMSSTDGQVVLTEYRSGCNVYNNVSRNRRERPVVGRCMTASRDTDVSLPRTDMFRFTCLIGNWRLFEEAYK